MQRLQNERQKLFFSVLWPHALFENNWMRWKKLSLSSYTFILTCKKFSAYLILHTRLMCFSWSRKSVRESRDVKKMKKWKSDESSDENVLSTECEFISLLRKHQVPFFCSKLRLQDEVKFSSYSKKSIKLLAGGTWYKVLLMNGKFCLFNVGQNCLSKCQMWVLMSI